MKLAVLLATFNSQTYIRQQLDSLLNQTYNDFILYIRDDGSEDSTLQIISEYIGKHENIILLHDPVLHRKSMLSFMWLLEHIDADYYMFCDHDDVWLPNKIELTLKSMQSIDVGGKPALVCSDLVVVDENLKEIAPSLWSYMKLRPEILLKKKYAISCNLFTGCTMLINSKAKEVSLPVGKYAVMHDNWIGLNVIANEGKIVCIKKPLVLYRQHNNNVFGAKEVISKWNYYRYKLMNLSSVWNMYRRNYLMAREVFHHISILYFLFFRLLYLIKR